ncbi:uncharacterized protein K444DRAFT_78885 [Hyaloscypha bicolor E]|uniref:Uncharacterized protein n=1 Tax=Hyaloscypha bicolor E TaxID=1095630 RepID=A0A2J6SYB2_9HELO|nr:uncharacterized protein K444DRAFT_78885 [Hyaloscypha bicolor E]PMD55760.1 hypothetical protein K444DRAFT_78885 [Hyaloscypha bicolor E]
MLIPKYYLESSSHLTRSREGGEARRLPLRAFLSGFIWSFCSLTFPLPWCSEASRAKAANAVGFRESRTNRPSAFGMKARRSSAKQKSPEAHLNIGYLHPVKKCRPAALRKPPGPYGSKSRLCHSFTLPSRP